MSASVTADAVLQAYRGAAPQWNQPNVAGCEAVADILSMYQRAHAELEERRARKFDAAGRRRIAKAEKVRGAVGTLLRDLPELVEHVIGRTSGDTEHVASLVGLLGAARKTAGLWPNLDGTLHKFRADTEWARTADCIAAPILSAWNRANPGQKIGKPKSENQPATRLMVALLTLAGHDGLTLEQVAKHFNRGFGLSAFALLDAGGVLTNLFGDCP